MNQLDKLIKDVRIGCRIGCIIYLLLIITMLILTALGLR